MLLSLPYFDPVQFTIIDPMNNLFLGSGKHACKKFQDLYGPKAITPNMHLHTHLKQYILDYGPLHAFWCYPFEWYNGILGSFIQITMKNFCLSQACMHSGYISPDIAQFLSSDQLVTDAAERSEDADILKFIYAQSSQLRHVDCFALFPDQTLAKPLQPHMTRVLIAESLRQLKCIYEQLYPAKRVAQMSQLSSAWQGFS